MSLKPTDPSTESATLSVPLQSHHQSDSEKSSCYTPRRVAFCRDVLVGNIWLTINIGGGPTDDKPEVVASPPSDHNVLSVFLNLRVTDIRRCYDLWTSRGAQFITEPKVHATELRCYMRDPDQYLIEVGQTTMTTGPLDLYT